MDGCDPEQQPQDGLQRDFFKIDHRIIVYVSPAVPFARTNWSFSSALLSAGSAEAEFGELDALRIVRDSMTTSRCTNLQIAREEETWFHLFRAGVTFHEAVIG
jgi:hypothetical protein